MRLAQWPLTWAFAAWGRKFHGFLLLVLYPWAPVSSSLCFL